MDRDRDSRRPLDIPPEDRYGSRGQSYRPGGGGARSPRPDTLRGDSYRARSPPPRRAYVPPRARSRSPLPRADTYRRRSPSPRDRYVAPRGGDSYRARPRSPPPVRREDLPRDDLFRRDPDREPRRDFRGDRDFRDDRSYRDERDFRDDRAYPAARSPPRYRERERSPLPLKRTREPSPIDSRGRRTPPPAKRERLASPPPRSRYDDYPPSRANSPPRRGYSPRGERSPPNRGVTRGYRRADSRSPVRRNDRFVDPRGVDDWRRPAARSPSPPRATRAAYADDYDDRGRDSVATSRRSSPPVHPSRLPQTPAIDDRSSRPPPREPYDSREPYRARSPSLRDSRRDPSPLPVREREYPAERSYDTQMEDRVPPPREAYRADDPPARAPPTGPSGGYRAPSSAMAPPPAAPVSVSAHARAPVEPPSGPRGSMAPRGDFSAPRGRGGFRGGFAADFAPRGRGGGPGFGGRGAFGGADFAPRGGRGGGPGAYGRGQPFEREQQEFHSSAPPSGPRGSFGSQQPPPAFRQNSSSSATTYPRTQRFGPGAQAAGPAGETPTGPRAPSAKGFRRSNEASTGAIPTGPSASAQQIGHIPSGPASDRRVLDLTSNNASQAASNLPHPALRDLPKILPNGEKLPSMIDHGRLDRLAEETERLRKVIEAKEEKKRRGLREWEKLGRESEGAAVRSALAEESLRAFEDDAGEAF